MTIIKERTPFCDAADQAEHEYLNSKWRMAIYTFLTGELDTKEERARRITSTGDWDAVLNSREYSQEEKDRLQHKLNKMFLELAELRSLQIHRRATKKPHMALAERVVDTEYVI